MKLLNEIVIELLGGCNLECDFCFNKQGNENGRLMPLKKIFEILADIHKSGITTVRFTGGEPFLRKDLFDILKKAKSYNLYVILNTNGFLINNENKHYFKYVDLVLFSFHYLDRYKPIEKATKSLKDYNLKIIYCTIIRKENINQINTYYDLVSKIKQPNFFEWFLLRQIPNEINKKPLSNKDIEKIYQTIFYHNKKYKLNIKIANSLPFCTIKNNLQSICKGGSFDSGHSRLLIDRDCNYKLDYSSEVLGNFRNKKILDVWNSKKLENIRNYNGLDKDCKKCYYLKKCKGGLIGREYLFDYSNVKHLASVIIPTFNDSKRLSLLIKSLENQTINNFEVIIVDDGSTDDTKNTSKKLINNSILSIRYFYLNNTTIFGAGIARNFGAKHSKGDVLIFLDQDNVANNKLVENHLKEQENNDVILGYYSGYGNKKYYYDFEKLQKFVKKEMSIKKVLSEFRNNVFYNPESYSREPWKYFVSANFSIKKSLFLKYLFDENIIQWTGEDIDLGYRLHKDNNKIIFSKKCLSYNSSNKPMFNQKKFVSSMEVMIYLFNKYKTKEIEKFCIEWFNHVPNKFKNKYKLNFKNNKFEFKRKTIKIAFRLDDIGKLTNKTKQIIDFFAESKIPINLEVIPKKLNKDMIDYLLSLTKIMKLEIHQHGYSHFNYSQSNNHKYEFSDKRDLKTQEYEISKGREILVRHFGNLFYNSFTPPFHGFDYSTLKILNKLNFKSISALNAINFTSEIHQVNGDIDIIKNYEKNEFYPLNKIIEIYDNILYKKDKICIVLHPEKFNSISKINLLIELIKYFKKDKNLQFDLLSKM